MSLGTRDRAEYFAATSAAEFRSMVPSAIFMSAFIERVHATPADPARLRRATLDDLLKIAGRARTAAAAITRSFTLSEVTAKDSPH